MNINICHSLGNALLARGDYIKIKRGEKMRLVKSGFFAMLFLAALLAVSTSAVAYADPPNPCLMIPEIPYGQSTGADYQPDSCIT